MVSKKTKKEPKISIKKHNVKQKVIVKVHVDNSKKVGKTRTVYKRESSGSSSGSYTPVFIQSGNPSESNHTYTSPTVKPEHTIPTLVSQVPPTNSGFATPAAPVVPAVAPATKKRVRLNILPTTPPATTTSTSTTIPTTSTSTTTTPFIASTAPAFIVPAATTANSIPEPPPARRRTKKPNRPAYEIAEEKRLKAERRAKREQEKVFNELDRRRDREYYDSDSDYGKKRRAT